MDPIELQIQQQIAETQQQPGFTSYQPSFIEDTMIPIPKPVVPEADVPNPVNQTVGGLKNIIDSAIRVGRPFVNPRQTFLNYAANKAFGQTGAALFNVGMGILPVAAPMIKRAASAVGRAIRPDPQQQGIAAYINQVYGTTPTGQISTGPMAGYNIQSGFGSPGAIDSAIKRIGKIASSRRKRESGALEKKQKALENYVSNVQKQMTIQKGGIGADRLVERDKPSMNIPDRNRGQVPTRTTPSRPSASIPDRGRGNIGGGADGRSSSGRSGGRSSGGYGGGASRGRGDRF